MDTILTIVKLLGGLGLFIYGMKLMGDGLENAAGEGACPRRRVRREAAPHHGRRGERRHAGLETDRRHVPRLRPRHSAEQRQEAFGQQRRVHERG